MNEEKKRQSVLAVDFTQFLLRCVAEDLEATKELLGPGSPLSGNESRAAAGILRNIADGLSAPYVVDANGRMGVQLFVRVQP